MLGFVNSNFIASSAVGIVLPVSLLFGGLVQLMVAVLEVIRGNILGARVFGTLGAFWIIYGLYVPFFSGSVAPASSGTSVALFLAMFAVIAWYHALSGLVAGTFDRSFLPVGYIGPLAPKAELSGVAGGGRNG
jgi:succinate-acetate transporter protein